MGTALFKGNPQRSERDCAIIAERAKGAAYSEIAARFGISSSTVSNILSDEDIKDILDTGMSQLVALVPLAIRNYATLAQDDADPKLQRDVSKDLLQMVGIMPGHTVNQYLVNIYQTNSITLHSTVVNALQGTLTGLGGDDSDVIDVEGEDVS